MIAATPVTGRFVGGPADRHVVDLQFSPGCPVATVVWRRGEFDVDSFFYSGRWDGVSKSVDLIFDGPSQTQEGKTR